MAGSPSVLTKSGKPDTENGSILNVLIKLENKGRSKQTIESVSKALRKMGKFSDINNPESVEKFIAKLQVSDSYKASLCGAYMTFCNYYKIDWERPRYSRQSKQFRVPTTEKLNLLIAEAHFDLSLKLQISKTCGLRPIEIVNLTPEQIDTDRKTISPITAKHGAPRTLPLTENLCNQLKAYISKNNIQPKQKLFPITSHSFSHIYQVARNRLAKKFNDPTINQIRLYDFRHYFGTTTIQKTGSTPLTAYYLGHKDWKNTKVYVDINTVLSSIEQDYVTATAKTVDECCKLIEQGFTKADEVDGIKIYKKRK